MAILNSNEVLGTYKVQNLIKANHYTETYRVVDYNQNPFFLKLFIVNKIPQKLVDAESNIVHEIDYCQQLNHRNLISCVHHGVFERECGICQYYVTDYFQGSILSDYLATNGVLPEEKALIVFRSILNGLKYLHNQTPILCHNDLDPSNIMLSPTLDGEAVIIDYGHLSPVCGGITGFDTADLNPLYHAKETMVGVFEERGDIFSACAILYFMLTGSAPWEIDMPSEGEYRERFKALWQYRAANPLDLSGLNVRKKTKYIIEQGLMPKASDRFESVEKILRLLDAADEKTIDYSELDKGGRKNIDSDSSSKSGEREINTIDIEIKRGKGKGFQDIAGMQHLKDYLAQKVIFVIKNRDIALEYRLTPPNGMLLYGPPGCGKTYIAEKFAEETGFNFMVVKSSDIGSSLVHGTQEKVKKLFQQAEKNAPIVLCFDEFDALVPDRGTHGNEYVATEVNEFLSQMNNCSQRGIFIVATSNRPDKIDPAVLRTGRIDKQVFVPLPDYEARKEIFNMHLNNRPVEDKVDLDALAHATEGYIASDIAFIVNDAAMTAAFTRQRISQALLVTSIENNRPSLRKEVVEEYTCIKDKMNSIARRAVVSAL